MKLLINSLGNDDIFNVIGTSPIDFKKKEWLKKEAISCSVISQLGSVILDLLGINVRVAHCPQLGYGHIFNWIPLGKGQVLFADFHRQIFEIVDVNHYYRPAGEYYIALKKEHYIPSESARKIDEQWNKGFSPNLLKEILYCGYPYIYITEDYVATYSIYLNRSTAYFHQGGLNQAIAECNQALRINPNFAIAYVSRGNAYGAKGNLKQAIADYGHALRINPILAMAYRNRAIAYFHQGNYTKAWEDVHKAQSLGEQIHPEFLQELRRASGRDR